MQSIIFENITFGYSKDRLLFKDLSFKIENKNGGKGFVTALMGVSGSGKSTLLKLMLDIEKPFSGRIHNYSEQAISYLPQEPVLFDHLSPLTNARYFATTSFYKKRFDETLFGELVDSLNMREVLSTSKSVSDLSGGQKQRISLLRALSIRPDILLLDEPTNGLDAEVKLLFLSKLKEMVIRYNLLIIYVTHHKLEAEMLADEIVFLSRNGQSEIINFVHQDSLLNFVKQPPLLEAVKVFKYPYPNIIQCSIVNRQLIIGGDDQQSFFITLDADHLNYNRENGFSITGYFDNSLYSSIQLDGSLYYLSVPKQNYIPTDKLTVSGTFSCFNPGGNAAGTIQVNENKIIYDHRK